MFKAGAAATRSRATPRTPRESATAQLQAEGIEFFDVDKAAFKEKAQSVYEKYAGELGGMAVIDQVAAQ